MNEVHAPVVSIITPCFNASKYLEAQLRSISDQTYLRWEQIVVDDGSTDGSGDIVRRHMERDARVRMITQPNRGVCAARNAGAAVASCHSRYLWFPDADDLFHKGVP